MEAMFCEGGCSGCANCGFMVARVGERAPDFKMEAVMPEGDFLERFGEVSLAKNMKAKKWTVLYFYPADFTFVCPTEIRRFNELYAKFKAEGAELIACSTDSTFCHLNWQEGSLGRLDHPHAADRNQEVSAAYGVLDAEKGLAWRGTFIISPDGILKSASINHGEIGRNVDEVLRTLQAAKAEAEGKLMGCNWQPGEESLTKG